MKIFLKSYIYIIFYLYLQNKIKLKIKNTMKKTISILSVFTVSFFYSQENNNDTKNENENKIISKKDFNFDSNHKNIIKIENQKPIHIEIFQYNNKEYKIKKNKSINDINLSIFNKNYSELEEKLSNYNTIDNNIVAIRYENLSEIENTTYKVDRMLENKYIYKADKTKTYWS